jgi:2-iminobutanoate/2-iminopropanoate deaminase
VPGRMGETFTMRRESFEIERYAHGGNPIPAVTRIGNLVLTGGVSGIDTSNGKMPAALEDQCSNMFVLAGKALKAAHAKWDDVVKVTIFMKAGLSREAVNREWLKYFPDPHSRPVRHTLVNEYLAAGVLIQCELMAKCNRPRLRSLKNKPNKVSDKPSA